MSPHRTHVRDIHWYPPYGLRPSRMRGRIAHRESVPARYALIHERKCTCRPASPLFPSKSHSSHDGCWLPQSQVRLTCSRSLKSNEITRQTKFEIFFAFVISDVNCHSGSFLGSDAALCTSAAFAFRKIVAIPDTLRWHVPCSKAGCHGWEIPWREYCPKLR